MNKSFLFNRKKRLILSNINKAFPDADLKNSNRISCVEPNDEMYFAGKANLKNFKNITWHKAKAEKLPFNNDSFFRSKINSEFDDIFLRIS